MGVRTGWMAVAVLAVALGATARMTGQAPPPPAQPPVEGHGGPPPPGAQAPAPPRQGQRRDLPRFPAHQRPPADPAVLERGRGLYAGNCGPCHGVDARGGQLGGPNLLRSQLVLADRDGELIVPVVHQGRPGTIMVPRPDIPEADVKAMATYLHHLQAQGSNQGGPPPGEEVPLDILVGDAKAGAAYFAKQCASCHSTTGDLQGLASRVPEAMALQNLWVSGGRAAGRRQFRPPSERSRVKATIALPSGEKVEGALVRIDDFSVTVRLADDTQRTFRRTGDVPKVTLVDPLEGHQQLLLALSNADMHDVTAYLATLK
jgi:cytochrome c oxidase cbb3-type subunit 3